VSWDLPAVIANLDWINLMTYGMTDSSSPVTDFESPLRRLPADPSPAAPNGGDTIEGAVSFYEAAGDPAAKIVIGAPFYGEVFTHVPGRGGGLFQRFRRLRATPSYAEIESSYGSGFRRYFSPTAGEPWLYSHRLRQFVTYDDTAAMAAKARYVIAAHLRGAMVWEISMDDAAHSLIDAAPAHPRLDG
jgi:chitinase